MDTDDIIKKIIRGAWLSVDSRVTHQEMGILVTLQTGLLTAIWTLVDLAIYIALVSWLLLVKLKICSRFGFNFCQTDGM
jgi:hypothetical protein